MSGYTQTSLELSGSICKLHSLRREKNIVLDNRFGPVHGPLKNIETNHVCPGDRNILSTAALLNNLFQHVSTILSGPVCLFLGIFVLHVNFNMHMNIFDLLMRFLVHFCLVGSCRFTLVLGEHRPPSYNSKANVIRYLQPGARDVLFLDNRVNKEHACLTKFQYVSMHDGAP